MKPGIFVRRPIIVFFITALLTVPAGAQSNPASPTQQQLFDTLASLDSALFSIAYTCQPEKIAAFFSEDLEFYHDKGGPTISREKNIEKLKKSFCGDGAIRLRRELVKGSLQVFPMDRYGAIQTGEHRFYITENGQPERLSGIAKFTHLWQFKDNQWKITRVLSYDHREL